MPKVTLQNWKNRNNSPFTKRYKVDLLSADQSEFSEDSNFSSEFASRADINNNEHFKAIPESI